MLFYEGWDFCEVAEISAFTARDMRELPSPNWRAHPLTGIFQPDPDNERMDDQISLVTGVLIQ